MLTVLLAIIYVLLVLSQKMFALYTKEYSAGLMTLSFVIAISCFISSFYISASIWSILTLLEYNHFIKL